MLFTFVCNLGSIAEKRSLKVGDVLLAVNDISVMDATHQEVVKIMSQGNFAI